jgi:hypothetical protein
MCSASHQTRTRPTTALELDPNYAQASLGETTRPVTSWLDAVPGHACWSVCCLPADYGEGLFIAANRQRTQHQRMVQGSGGARGIVAHHDCMHAVCKRTTLIAVLMPRSRGPLRDRGGVVPALGIGVPPFGWNKLSLPLRGAICPCLGVLSSFEGLTGHESF